MTHETSESICNLPEDELRERIAALRRDLLPLVKRNVPLPSDAGVALEFDATPALRDQLETLVAFERQCCGGLEWSLSPESDEQTLRLSIAGVAPNASFFQTLGIAAEPTALAAPARGGVSRFAKAGGLGVGAAFFLFCVVPIGLAAIGGATFAAWLRPLDHPAVVLVGGAAMAIPVWWRLRRREAAAGC